MSLDDDLAAARYDADTLAEGILGLIGLGALKTANDDSDAITFLSDAYRNLGIAPPTPESVASARIAIIRGEGALELLITKQSKS